MAGGAFPELSATRFADWAVRSPQMLQAFLAGGNPRAQVECRPDLGGGRPQINVQNIDDGINIRARMYRLYSNDDALEWDAYVDSIVLCRSEKDCGMSDPRWDLLWDQRGGYVDDLGELRRADLVRAIGMVVAALATELDLYAAWRDMHPQAQPQPPAPAPQGESFFQLPPRSQRPFLHYGQPLWEGRYDTMVPAIWNETLGRWTYLIEHRFH